MRTWLVAGAIIEGPAGVLLVANRRRDGSIDWTPPGGVVDEGEDVMTGLGREVEEETGLVIASWRSGPLYRIEADAPDLGWHLEVEVHRAASFAGEMRFDDPDGIVVDAAYHPEDECRRRLSSAPPWVHRPLSAWLDERWDETRTFRYRIEGRSHSSLRVHDVD